MESFNFHLKIWGDDPNWVLFFRWVGSTTACLSWQIISDLDLHTVGKTIAPRGSSAPKIFAPKQVWENEVISKSTSILFQDGWFNHYLGSIGEKSLQIFWVFAICQPRSSSFCLIVKTDFIWPKSKRGMFHCCVGLIEPQKDWHPRHLTFSHLKSKARRLSTESGLFHQVFYGKNPNLAPGTTQITYYSPWN